MAEAATAPSLKDLAEAAFRVLGAHGAPTDAAAGTGEPGWNFSGTGAGGAALDVALAGPDIPGSLDEDIAPGALIASERPWKGTYRLVIRAPVVVFDIYWTPAEPLRIMTFSRGDWERDLLARAG